MRTDVDEDRFPEWRTFADAVQSRSPATGTLCDAWTVRDIVIHQTGNAEELARVLRAHLDGKPVTTRRFEEREAPYRVMNDIDLWSALVRQMGALSEVANAGDQVPAETDVAWTGRTMKVPWFAEHMREELVLHRWDITGDDAESYRQLSQPWMTTHSVVAVGKPLLARGMKVLNLGQGERFGARLRVPEADDVAVDADADGCTIALTASEGDATLETDSAARVLLLWGRKPADPSRIKSTAGPQQLGQTRALLSGY